MNPVARGTAKAIARGLCLPVTAPYRDLKFRPSPNARRFRTWSPALWPAPREKGLETIFSALDHSDAKNSARYQDVVYEAMERGPERRASGKQLEYSGSGLGNPT